jgi:hypothetical protein
MVAFIESACECSHLMLQPHRVLPAAPHLDWTLQFSSPQLGAPAAIFTVIQCTSAALLLYYARDILGWIAPQSHRVKAGSPFLNALRKRLSWFTIALVLGSSLAALLVAACGLSEIAKSPPEEPPPPPIPMLAPQVESFEPSSLIAGQNAVVTLTGLFAADLQIQSKGPCRITDASVSGNKARIALKVANRSRASTCQLRLKHEWSPKLKTDVSLPIQPAAHHQQSPTEALESK